MQAQMRLLSEEKDRMHRESLSLQKQLDYYKVRDSLIILTHRVKQNHYKRG